MPASLDSTDKRLVIGAAVAMLLLLGATYLVEPGTQRQQSTGFPSSYSSKSDGAKAAYLFLQQRGYDLARWENSPGELPNNL